DLYDFLQYSGQRMAVAVGDVSGKGAPAAIYAALVSGYLRSHSAAEYGPAEMLARVNESLRTRPIEAQFISMIYALWDDAARTLQIANSGLPRPIFVRDGKLEIIQTTGLPLGLFPDATYDVITLAAQPGDLFVFFSDGLIDARNASGELFGRERVHEVVLANRDRSAEEVASGLFAAAQ